MKNVKLEVREIEYLRELVNEAWMYKRSEAKLMTKEQEDLSMKLKKSLENQDV